MNNLFAYPKKKHLQRMFFLLFTAFFAMFSQQQAISAKSCIKKTCVKKYRNKRYYNKNKKTKIKRYRKTRSKRYRKYRRKKTKFASTLSKFFGPQDYKNKKTLFWQTNSPQIFDELILSWNAQRPKRGTITFWVSVKHTHWSPWHRLAEWGKDYQQTFVNKHNPYVHTKHVRIHLQKGRIAKAFRVKAIFKGGASSSSLHALFACFSNIKKFHPQQICFKRPSICIKNIPRQSQMILDHDRAHDLCSPTSLNMIIKYFANKLYRSVHSHSLYDLHDSTIDLAERVHDDGSLDIYGNWILNIAEAYQASQGNVFYRVERLNSFNELYQHLARNIPIAVSVRRLQGGATPYANGHIMVIIGWNKKTQSVICLDPAFNSNKDTLKTYHIKNFLRAWGRSRHLSYVPILKKSLKKNIGKF